MQDTRLLALTSAIVLTSSLAHAQSADSFSPNDLSPNNLGPWTNPQFVARFDPAQFTHVVTPIDRMPTTGTANYNGVVAGGAVREDIIGNGTTQLGPLSGSAAFSFNFGTRAANSVFSNLSASGTAIPITLTSAPAGSQITGNTFTTLTVMGGSGRDQATAACGFYGPNAQFVAGTLNATLLGLTPAGAAPMSANFFINDAKFGANRH